MNLKDQSEILNFIESLYSQMLERDLNISALYIDHLCYRVGNLARYNEIKELLNSFGKLLTEKEIGGRPIASFKLHSAIKFKDQLIPLIELPSPKSGKVYAEGWEHFEMVTRGSLEDFIAEHPHVEFDQGGMNKTVNRELRLKLGNFSVKFHEQSLEEVIFSE
jgi:predicted metalloenzyme YecM